MKTCVHKHMASREVGGMCPGNFCTLDSFTIASGAFSGVHSSQLLYLPKRTISNDNHSIY